MNLRLAYVRKLDAELQDCKDELAELKARVVDLERYLWTSKFSAGDRMGLVSREDVMSRLGRY